MPDLNSNLLALLVSVLVALSIGSAVRIVALRKADKGLAQKRMGSLKVWWTLAILLSLAVVFGRVGTSALLAIAGILGMKEFLNLPGLDRAGRPTRVTCFVLLLVQYGFIAFGRESEAKFVLPVVALLAISVARLGTGETEGYVRTTAGAYFGVMLLVYCLSHAALLLTLPFANTPVVGVSGWFLFVVIITEMDDISQALVGRLIGRTKITPKISPNKTWEGFGGGVVTSVVLALLLAPWLTTFPSITTGRGFLLTAGSGLLIVVAAFLGDINMSAIKRDVGVKDGSAILPGMGGVIDRVDSLTFTAPAFYYFLWLTS